MISASLGIILAISISFSFDGDKENAPSKKREKETVEPRKIHLGGNLYDFGRKENEKISACMLAKGAGV